MAIELNKRTKILAGVVVLAAVGAGAWVFFLEDFLSEPPPPPQAVAKSSAPAGAPKAPAAKDDGKAAASPKPAAAKAAAAAPGAKPIPTNPARLVAEVLEKSGIQEYFQSISREVMVAAAVGMDAGKQEASPTEYLAMSGVANAEVDPAKLAAEITANLKAGAIDDERMVRFLELLRQPIVAKMTAPGMRSLSAEALKEHAEGLRKNPPPAARLELIRTLSDISLTGDVGADVAAALARDMVDTMLESVKKAGKNAPKDAQQTIGAQLNALRNQARAQLLTMMYVMYRKASDEELSEYVKLLDTDTGRWGSELLANAVRPSLVARGGVLGREAAKVALARMTAGTQSAARQPSEQQAEKAAEKPAQQAAAPVAVPAAAPAYQRAANIRDVYSRYNDVITATVMRDLAAVKELLADGKSPNVRQSNGMTALMVAASNGDAEIAAALLAKGADPNASAGGRTALSIARSKGSAGNAVANLLSGSGARQ